MIYDVFMCRSDYHTYIAPHNLNIKEIFLQFLTSRFSEHVSEKKKPRWKFSLSIKTLGACPWTSPLSWARIYRENLFVAVLSFHHFCLKKNELWALALMNISGVENFACDLRVEVTTTLVFVKRWKGNKIMSRHRSTYNFRVCRSGCCR